MAKFVENQFEKLQRLFELHVSLKERVDVKDGARAEALGHVAEEMGFSKADVYLQRCDDGLAALQQTDLLILRLANLGNKQLLEAVRSLFALKGVKKKELLTVIEEYCENVDGEKGEAEVREVERYMRTLLEK